MQKLKDSPVIEIRANTNDALLSQIMVNTYYDVLFDRYYTDKLVVLNQDLDQLRFAIDSLETQRAINTERSTKLLDQSNALISAKDKHLIAPTIETIANRRLIQRIKLMKDNYELKSQYLDHQVILGSSFTLLYNSFEAHCTDSSRFKPSLICFALIGTMLTTLMVLRGLILRVVASDSNVD